MVGPLADGHALGLDDRERRVGADAYSHAIVHDMNLTTVYTDGGAAPTNPGPGRYARSSRAARSTSGTPRMRPTTHATSSA
jgi:hypothetical protein